jgi:hypothetical protein
MLHIRLCQTLERRENNENKIEAFELASVLTHMLSPICHLESIVATSLV